jgi:hypothetical protein
MDYSWVFERESDRLTIRRSTAAESVDLLVAGDGMNQRTLTFGSPGELLEFQIRFEEHLLRTGWRLVAFAPDRRSSGDRRAGPTRSGQDRRRLLRFPTSNGRN